MEIYNVAIRQQYGYLITDTDPQGNDGMRLISNALPLQRNTVYKLL